MRLTIWSCAAVLLLGVASSAADAFCCTPMWHCPPPPCCVTYQHKVVTSYRPEWREEKVPCVVQKVTYQQQVKKVAVQVPVERMFDQQVTTNFTVAVPKVIERDVTRCVMVAVPVFDPCTCCCYMTFKPSCCVEKVRCTVYEQQLQTRVDIVKVCKTVLEERVVDQVCTVPVVVNEQSWTVRRTCVMVPCQTTVVVPVWVPCCP